MMLEVANIEKKYFQGGREIPVLNGVQFSLEKGKTMAIVGKSGSGKSTLLSLLSGVDRADRGSINFINVNLTEMDEKSITKIRSEKMGIIFQQFFLIPHLTALENVALPLQINGVSDAFKIAQEYLVKVGLKDRVEHFPDQLSGGEKQRVALARALVHSPDLILADEPSGSLDEHTGNEVMKLIFDLVREQNKSLILVTHDSELAAKCDQQYVLENGSLHLRT
ncbi:MAG: ABC transporter ATP-binding protein [Bdellovibrio sp.]